MEKWCKVIIGLALLITVTLVGVCVYREYLYTHPPEEINVKKEGDGGTNTVLSVTGSNEEKCLKYVQKLLTDRYGEGFSVTSISIHKELGVPYIEFTSPYSLTKHTITYPAHGIKGLESWYSEGNDTYWSELSGWLSGELLLNLYRVELEDGIQIYSDIFETGAFKSPTSPSLFTQTLSYIESQAAAKVNKFNLFTESEVEKDMLQYEEHWRGVIRLDAMEAIIANRDEEHRLVLFVQNIYQIDEIIEALKNNRYNGNIEVYTVAEKVPLAPLDYVIANLSEEEKSSLVEINLDSSEYDTTGYTSFEFELGKLVAEEADLDTDRLELQLLDSGIPYTEDIEEQLEGLAEILDWYTKSPSAVVYNFGSQRAIEIDNKLNKRVIGWNQIFVVDCEAQDRELSYTDLQEKYSTDY